MKVIIVGCGKMGSNLALELVKKGHAVTVVEANIEQFSMLGKAFKGETIVGIGFDKQILEQAGVRRADEGVEQPPVAEVDAVETADGQGRGPRMRRTGQNVGDGFHGPLPLTVRA